jgi:hypothetical protein
MQHTAAGHFVEIGRLIIVHLLTAKDETLLLRRNPLFFFDLSVCDLKVGFSCTNLFFDARNFVVRFNVQLDFLAC